MPNIIFKTGNYDNEDVIENLVNYIEKKKYFDSSGSGGCFLLPNINNAEQVKVAFNTVKNACAKNGGRLVHHIVVGFGDLPDISGYTVKNIADWIVLYFLGKGYQTFYGIHFSGDKNDRYWHIHIVLNSVNAITGERYCATYDNMGDLKNALIVSTAGIYPDMQWIYSTSESFFHRS